LLLFFIVETGLENKLVNTKLSHQVKRISTHKQIARNVKHKTFSQITLGRINFSTNFLVVGIVTIHPHCVTALPG
jgi:hypothetical protein